MTAPVFSLILLSVALSAFAQVVLKLGMSGAAVSRALAEGGAAHVAWAVASEWRVLAGLTLYLASAVIGSCFMLFWAWDIFARRDDARDRKACWRMFGGSILVLFALFASLLLERVSAPLLHLATRFMGFGA